MFNWNWFPHTDFSHINADWIADCLRGLLGGLRGQVLSKKSDDDFDFEWTTMRTPAEQDAIDHAQDLRIYAQENINIRQDGEIDALEKDVDVLMNQPHNYAYDGGDLLTRFGSMAAIHDAVSAGDFRKIFVGDYIPVTLNGQVVDHGRRYLPEGTALYASEADAISRTDSIGTTTGPYIEPHYYDLQAAQLTGVGWYNVEDTEPMYIIENQHTYLMEVAAINPYINSGSTEIEDNHLLLMSRDEIDRKIMMLPSYPGQASYYDPTANNPYFGSTLYATLNDNVDSYKTLFAASDIGPYLYTGDDGDGMQCWWFNMPFGSTATPTAASTRGRGVVFLPTETECWGAQFYMRDRFSVGSLLVRWKLLENSMKHVIKRSEDSRTSWWTATFTQYNRGTVNTPTGNMGDRAMNNQNNSIPLCVFFK